MLAVNLHQQSAQFAQNADAGGLIVHEGPGPAIGADNPPKDQILVGAIVDALVVETGPDARIRRRRKHRGRDGLAGPTTHQPGVGPDAGRQSQRIKNDRFSRPRLAGEHGEAGAEREVQAVDENQITDRQADQHGTRMTENPFGLKA